jgi:serine/threonine-protein kinase RsbW
VSRAELRLILLAQPESAAVMRHVLSEFLTALCVDADRQIDIITAVGEALANSIEHAYTGAQTGSVELRARALAKPPSIAVTIADHGRFLERPSADHRGFGLRIIKSAARSVRIDKTKGTTMRLLFATGSA